MHNIQVTFDQSTANARSESSLVIDPANPLKMVAGSKKFTNPNTYDFTLATSWSDDGGLSWHPSADLDITGWDGISDPALAYDDKGNFYLVALPFKKQPDIVVIGIAVYKSTDGGKTWGKPQTIHTSAGDDKQWAAGDAWSASYKGRVYAAWDDGSNLRFARTRNGNSWEGAGNGTAVGTVIASGSFAPEINVAKDGTIYVVYLSGTTVKLLVSTNGGDSFQQATAPATNITTLGQTLPVVNGWSEFPGGSFRVLTLPTACAGSGQTVAVAWADTRTGPARTYYALSHDRGQTWQTGPSGQPLLSTPIASNMQHFHPQLIAHGLTIACAFYEFGPKNGSMLIDTIAATSIDNGQSFTSQVVTDQPWDPAVDAPWSHGDPQVTFIGDYFGIDASANGFYPLWTDTRTGIQELFIDRVSALQVPKFDPNRWAIVAEILFGVTGDGGGAIRIGGKIIPIPPWDPDGPIRDILFALATYQLVGGMGNVAEANALRRAAMASVSRMVSHETSVLGHQAVAPALAERGNGEAAVRAAATHAAETPRA